jgi:hypothetical protein
VSERGGGKAKEFGGAESEREREREREMDGWSGSVLSRCDCSGLSVGSGLEIGI